ncbi:helix-turn-helix domain-containing protein [Brevibacillus panacihumi]|uniref:helix-turn-helix domain-containing protein n=1 Tax=Brevibacillus panacihumi TaxID=497735 RepID=UPI003CFF686E
MEVYSKKELAATLNISPRTITRWVQSYGLPVQVVGNGKYLFRADRVVKWLQKRTELTVGNRL